MPQDAQNKNKNWLEYINTGWTLQVKQKPEYRLKKNYIT